MQNKTDLNLMKTQKVEEINGVTTESLKDLMASAKIPGISIASYEDGIISKLPLGKTLGNNTLPSLVDSETKFGAASLSKPVFAYLVLKLIETNKANDAIKGLGKFNTEFNLKTPLFEVFKDKNGTTLLDHENPFLKKFIPEHQEWAKRLNAEMVLSHRTGLHIVSEEPFSFQFEPGTYYAYSGPGIACLQTTIHAITDNNDLESLAKKNVFVPLKMPNSTYGDDGVAANSLRTTAAEYAQFITSWINDAQLNYAFRAVEPFYSMENDYFPQSEDMLVSEVTGSDDRKSVTWGLGIGLVKNEQGDVIGAYHTGDMNEWRAGFGAEIDPKTKQCITATVYCANSYNGHILAEPLLPKSLTPALNYFFPTYGFARNVKELDGTNFHGMNPKILKPDLCELAEKTKEITSHFRKELQMLKQDDPHLLTSNENFSEENVPHQSYVPT